jgi:CheY-like chemotaxis protein
MSENTTVLVLEDEQGLAQLYATWLDGDYAVRTATTAAEARQRATADVDVALIDRRLPDEPGDEVLSWLRDRPFECGSAMLTAVHPGEDLLELPVDDYLLKPVDRSEVLETVERLDRVVERETGARRVASLAARWATLEGHRRRPGAEAVADRLRERLQGAVDDLDGGADGDPLPIDEEVAPVLPDGIPVADVGSTDRADVASQRDGSGSESDPSDAERRPDRLRVDSSGSVPEQGDRPVGTGEGVGRSRSDRAGAGDRVAVGGTPRSADRDDPGPRGEAARPGRTDESSPDEGVIDHDGDGDSDRAGDVNPRRDLPDGVSRPESDPQTGSDRPLADDAGAGSVEWFDGRSTVTVRHDPATDRYVTTHDWNGPQSLVVTIVEAVAVIEGRPPGSIEAMHDRVDTHALDALFGDGDGIDGRVSFRYAGHRVTVDADGEVLVERADD